MEGRWLIWIDKDDGPQVRVKGPDMPWEPVEVVPCDDAAIERGGAELAGMFGWSVSYSQYMAKAVLRAAGETP